MPDRSRWSVEVPKVSIPSFIFGSPSGNLPDNLAYADADAPSTLYFTWSTFREWSKRFAAGLIIAGLQQGDRVLIFSANDVFYPVLYMGIIMAGGIYTSANARYVPRELAYHLQSCEAKFVLSSDANLPVALEAAKQAGIKREQIFIFNDDPLLQDGSGIDDKKEGVQHWKHLIASPERGAKFAWEDLTPEQSMTRTAALNYSSGTTGLPKGVESSHYSFIANAIQTDYVMSLDLKLSTYEKAARNSRWICVIPLYHGLAQCYFFTIAARRRIATYIMKSYELNRMLKHVQNFKISELHLVPPIVVAITKHQGIKSGNCDLSSVTKTFSCAAPLGAEVCVQYEALWPKGVMNVKQGFAMSESTCNILGWDPTLTSPPGSVGEPMPNCILKLMSDDEQEVHQDERGEIWVQCPNIMNGYWRNPKATADTITADGWLKTGDVAYRDSEGRYYIVDRKKELIKVKGVQVAPAELESLLLDHPQVADAAVIGVKSEEDEVPRAYIVPKSEGAVTARDILEYMEGKVSRIKRLSGGVVFTDAIPKNPSGKILRRLLRDRAARDKPVMAKM